MTEPETARLFIALWPDDATREAIDARSRALPWPEAARRTAAERLHLTLHFLGSVVRERLPVLAEGIALASGPIELCLDRVELWNRQLAVLLAAGTPPELADLHARLAGRLQALGFECEMRPFRPHVTLGRRAAGLPPGATQPLRWRSEGFALAESRGGYQLLQRYG